MQSHALWSSALALGLALTGCNDIIGASSPDTGGEQAHDDGDGEEGVEAAPLCGNGVMDAGEECDDGNDADSDGCYRCRHDCGPLPEFKWSLTGECYLLAAPETVTWRVAETACEAWGGKLAALTSVDEFAFVQEHVREDTWIGGHDPAGADSFEWVTGEPWKFESFKEKPKVDSSEACVLIGGDYLAMRRVDCDLAGSYVCEKAPVSSVE